MGAMRLWAMPTLPLFVKNFDRAKREKKGKVKKCKGQEGKRAKGKEVLTPTRKPPENRESSSESQGRSRGDTQSGNSQETRARNRPAAAF